MTSSYTLHSAGVFMVFYRSSFLLGYYANGQTVKASDFTNVTVLDKFINETKNARAVQLLYQPGAELWLGETSSCYHGGASGLSNAYIAGFLYACICNRSL